MIETGYYVTKDGIYLYLAENERFYYKDPIGRWYVYDINFIPTQYFYLRQDQQILQNIPSPVNKNSKALIFCVDPKTGVNYPVDSMEDIYKLDFELCPEEYTRLINELISQGKIKIE